MDSNVMAVAPGVVPPVPPCPPAPPSAVPPIPPRKQTKNARLLLVFFCGARLTRFDAEAHFDHCLNSTISTLEGFGLVFDRRSERVPCVKNTRLTRCNRYWLHPSPANLTLAHDLLKQWGAL